MTLAYVCLTATAVAKHGPEWFGDKCVIVFDTCSMFTHTCIYIYIGGETYSPITYLHLHIISVLLCYWTLLCWPLGVVVWYLHLWWRSDLSVMTHCPHTLLHCSVWSCSRYSWLPHCGGDTHYAFCYSIHTWPTLCLALHNLATHRTHEEFVLNEWYFIDGSVWLVVCVCVDDDGVWRHIISWPGHTFATLPTAPFERKPLYYPLPLLQQWPSDDVKTPVYYCAVMLVHCV